MKELLPHGKGGLANVLLAALQPRQVCSGDCLPALAQKLQRVQAGSQVLLCPVTQRHQRLQADTELSSDVPRCQEKPQSSHVQSYPAVCGDHGGL